MLVIPAIDIKDGKCVRLYQGDFNEVTTYSENPVEIAINFAKNKSKIINVIDLDGAKTGKPVNKEVILNIINTVNIPVLVGGGIRTYEVAKTYLNSGAKRIILSTAAIENQKLVKQLIKEFSSDRIIIAADIKNNKFAIHGWVESGELTVPESIALLKNVGIKYVLVTDVSKDGSLSGPNYELVQKFIDSGLQTIAAGGVSSLPDIIEFNKRGAYGTVVGKAIYEGKINITQAQASSSYVNNLAKRIIPCLDVKNGQVVKGTNFKKLRVIGDPVAMAKQYDQNGADELVLLDISATIEGRKTFKKLVKQVAEAITIPFTVGGGITTLDDINTMLQAGADKVSIGSTAVLKPEFIKQAVDYFGSQCIVISIDAKRSDNWWLVYIKGGTENSGINVINLCTKMEEYGVGEILINSLDRDGTNKGFYIDLIRAITKKINITVIASSGGGSAKDYLDVFTKTGVDAALGASIFHDGINTPAQLKEFLAKNKIRVRKC